MRSYQQRRRLFDAQAATGVSTAWDVSDFRHVTLAIHFNAAANMTMRVQASISDAAPDFTAAQSLSNSWDYIQCVDLEDSAGIDGDVGIIPVGAADDRNISVNTNGIKWLSLRVTTYAAGAVTAYAKPFAD